MYSLTYVSSALAPFTPRELRELLETCNEKNRRQDVTGMLLYKDGNFMQVLEGPRAAVVRVHDTIARDSRHRGLITLLQGDTVAREFSQWSMGFQDLGADIDKPEGYSEFLNTPLTDASFISNPSRAQKLLFTFKSTANRFAV